MALPDPTFTINSVGGTDSVLVSAGGAIVAEIVDIAGVAPVSWEIERTDDSGVPGDYTFVQSGSVGQTYTGTALGAGSAGVIKCTVAGGYDPTTDSYSTELIARRKFWVPTAGSLEVIIPGETAEEDYLYLSSGTYGGAKPINALMRSSLAAMPGARFTVTAATTAALPAHTFSSGTITASANGALPAQDGVTLSNSLALLVKNEGASHLQHGVYIVTDIGSAGTPFVLTRHVDFDESAEALPGTTVYVQEGTTQANTNWWLLEPNPIVLNTTPLTFSSDIYLPRGASINSRDGSTGTAPLLRLDSSDNVQLGRNDADINGVAIDTPTGTSILNRVAGTAVLTVAGSSVTSAQALQLGASYSTTGLLRLPNNQFAKWRGSGAYDLQGIGIDNTNALILGANDANLAGILLDVATGKSVKINVAASPLIEFAAAQIFSTTHIQVTTDKDIDCYSYGGRLKPGYTSDTSAPTLDDGEIHFFRDEDDDRVFLLYDDPSIGRLEMAASIPTFGCIYTANGSTAQTGIGTSYTKVTGFASNGAVSYGVTADHTADTITVAETGLYHISFSISFSGTTVTIFTFAISVDGTENESLALQRQIGASGDVGNANFQGYLRLTASNAVSVEVKADGSSKSITPVFMNLSLEKVGV